MRTLHTATFPTLPSLNPHFKQTFDQVNERRTIYYGKNDVDLQSQKGYNFLMHNEGTKSSIISLSPGIWVYTI